MTFFLVGCCSGCLEVWWLLFALGCRWEDSVIVKDENTIEFFFFFFQRNWMDLLALIPNVVN